MTTPKEGHESGGGVMTKLLILLRRNPPLLLFCAFVLVVVTGRIANLDNRSSEHPTLDALPRSALQSIADVATRLAPPGTAYRGTTWHNERTVAVDTLGETKFARCDVHTVTSEDGTSVINDWIFLEELPAVNIVVQMDDGKFVVFRQRKYAIPGETLSPVGGFIDAGESPLTSAKREVLEELGLGSRRTMRSLREKMPAYYNGRGGDPKRTMSIEEIAEIIRETASPPTLDKFGLLEGEPAQVAEAEKDYDWIFLGRYRTAANRGGGFIYTYLLKNAIPLVPGGGTEDFAGTGDGEAQEVFHLDEVEVNSALLQGKFQEVKWAATFSLSMMHLRIEKDQREHQQQLQGAKEGAKDERNRQRQK